MESPSPPTHPPPPAEMPTVLQVVLHKSYDAIKAFAEWLKENTQHYIIGEHEADDEIKTTHTHILIEGLKVGREALRRQVQKYSPGQGQNFTSAKTTKSKQLYDRDKLAIYIIKGNSKHVKATSFDDIQIAIWASKWIVQAESKKADHGAVAPAKKKPNTIYEDCSEIADRLTWIKEPGQLPRLEERTEVVTEIIKWANEKGKALHSIQVMNYYDVVLQNAVPEYYKKLCTNLINRRHAFRN
jgi:hypothetical protein